MKKDKKLFSHVRKHLERSLSGRLTHFCLYLISQHLRKRDIVGFKEGCEV